MIRTSGVTALVLIAGCSTVSPTASAPATVDIDRHTVLRTVPTTRPTPTRHASRSRRPLPTVLLRIRSCESGPDGYATHGWALDADYTETNPSSTASGAFQFLDGTWQSTTGLPGRAKDYPPAVQDAAALKLYRDQGTAPWNASASCWRAS